MSEPDTKPSPKETHEAQTASMLNLAAFGSAQMSMSLSIAFTTVAAVTGNSGLAVMFGASVLPQAGLCWLNWKHLKHSESQRRPVQEPVERARHRCKDAFYRLATPLVILAITTGIAASFEATDEQLQQRKTTPSLQTLPQR